MNKSKALDPTSAAFLFTEKRTTPMHIAVLGIYKIPKGSDEAKFLQRLVDTVGDIERFRFPFGSRLHSSLTGPSWIADDDIDISYHLRRSGLATPGDFEQLFTLVSRLHGTSLDRERPLWEQHLINGLEGNRFAIYTKLHHAAIDGVGMAKTRPIHALDKKVRSLKGLAILSRATNRGVEGCIWRTRSTCVYAGSKSGFRGLKTSCWKHHEHIFGYVEVSAGLCPTG
jgi:hypothetical protein